MAKGDGVNRKDQAFHIVGRLTDPLRTKTTWTETTLMYQLSVTPNEKRQNKGTRGDGGSDEGFVITGENTS